jgi:hypothetical protein
MKRQPKYDIVPDNQVYSVWQCGWEDCDFIGGDRCVEISPDFYEQNGTPVCGCGADMEYMHTYVVRDQFTEELTNLLATLRQDAWMALADHWDRTDEGFDAQVELIEDFAEKYKLGIDEIYDDEFRPN